uniref:Uncharacterized protein n=1 Tax=Romanomermis culicivorax TaxID=13658 RepID=A0A915J1X7_ROMCU
MTTVLIQFFAFYFFTFSFVVDSQEHDNCTAFTLIEAAFSVFDRNKGQVCCPIIGCFANQSPDNQNQKIDNRSSINAKNDSVLSIDQNWKSWQHIARLPYCPDQIGLQFYCFSNLDSADRYKLIDYENLDRDGPKLAWKKNKQETVVIIHGWKTDWPSPWMNKMRDAFLGIVKTTCASQITNHFSTIVKTLWSTMSCSHQRAPAVYTEIIQKSAPKVLGQKASAAADPKAACSFLAFPCNSSKQWTNGQCFETCENDDAKHRGSACLRPSYILDDTMAGRKSPEKYFFDLRVDGAAQNDSEFCGRPVRIALNVIKEVKGTIKANFISKSSRIDNVTLLDRSKKLKPASSNSSSSRVIILPWTMTLQNLQFVEINYAPDRSLWAKVVNDKKDFLLKNVTITDLSDSKLQSCSDQIITMTKVNRIMLKTKC